MIAPFTLGPADGELTIRTDVTGRAARMGHRLLLIVADWHARIDATDGKPTAVHLTAAAGSLQVVSGAGGITPLSGPEKSVARGNALKVLDTRNFGTIVFDSDTVRATTGGYQVNGQVHIHGVTGPQFVTVEVSDDGPYWRVLGTAVVNQRDFGMRPYSMMMGALRVADEVTVGLAARVAK